MTSAFNAETISRACQIKQAIEACGHPSFKYRQPSSGCDGCVTNRMRDGHAIDLPDPRKKQEPQPTPTQS